METPSQYATDTLQALESVMANRDQRVTSYVTEEVSRDLDDLAALRRRLRLGPATISDVVNDIIVRYKDQYRRELEDLERKTSKKK
jgi:iron-sulfur cluster repair protein YtfE (RIC family)